MADAIGKECRSRNMSAIKSKDTKPEVYLTVLEFVHNNISIIPPTYIMPPDYGKTGA